MPQAAEVLLLKQALEQRFPNALPISYRTAGAIATGVTALDHMLPANGLPRGRLSLWKPGGGATAILYAACEAVSQRGERAAWIDAAGTIAVSVRDNGPGLDPDLADQPITAFATTKLDGLGLGLSLSRSIIEAHGGSLTIGSDQQGTTATFTLPAAGAAKP